MSAVFAIGSIFPLTVIIFYLFAFFSMKFDRLYFSYTWILAFLTAGYIIVKVDQDSILLDLLGILGFITSSIFLYVGIFSVFLCDSGICDSKKNN